MPQTEPEINLLVVEDDPDINHLLCRVLQKQGWTTTSAYSGSEARLRLETGRFDLILLDLMLPGATGEELVQEIRARQVVPIVVISAKTSLEDRVGLLKLGADDYITKPFEISEVAARVEAQLRRSREYSSLQQGRERERLTFRNLVLDREAMRAQVGGEELTLTAREFSILSLLLEHPDQVFTREMLYQMVWNDAYLGEDNTVNVHISNIRQKLARLSPGTEYIRTVWGIGFKLAEE